MFGSMTTLAVRGLPTMDKGGPGECLDVVAIGAGQGKTVRRMIRRFLEIFLVAASAFRRGSAEDAFGRARMTIFAPCRYVRSGEGKTGTRMIYRDGHGLPGVLIVTPRAF